MNTFYKVCIAGVLLLTTIHTSLADERPNFVWMMSEDVSPHFMALYNDGVGAKTPNVERLAQEGLIFNNAYCNAPVSSAARSTLFTGCYAPRLGVSHHRKLREVSLPEGFHLFPSYLRKAGYHTSNSAKTDYNCKNDSTAWDVVKGEMGEWRNRSDKNQPFFFVRTNTTSHESCLHFPKDQMDEVPTIHDTAAVKLLPQHPDTPLFRYTYATFYDHIASVDEELGQLIDMLKEDGELDNTFIFYFGDNGGALPGSKGYTTETGLRVPLVVYVPQKWRDKLPLPVGTKVDGFVSFMDFAPTLLHLAGIEVPTEMDGQPFLGTDITADKLNARDEVYGYGDRFGELYAFNRTVRKGDFKYSRNFLPHQAKGQYAQYRYKQAAFREWKKLYKTGQLNEVQSAFFQQQGPEELYDLSKDPYETVNLAGRPEYAAKVKALRTKLYHHMIEMNDLGPIPECVWLEEGGDDPVAYGQRKHAELARLFKVIDLQLSDPKKAVYPVRCLFRSKNPLERYWMVTACTWLGNIAFDIMGQVEGVEKHDTCIYNRSRALVCLSRIGFGNPASEVKHLLSEVKSEAEAIQVLNDAAYIKETSKKCYWDITENDIPFKSPSISWRVKYLMSKEFNLLKPFEQEQSEQEQPEQEVPEEAL